VDTLPRAAVGAADHHRRQSPPRSPGVV